MGKHRYKRQPIPLKWRVAGLKNRLGLTYIPKARGLLRATQGYLDAFARKYK